MSKASNCSTDAPQSPLVCSNLGSCSLVSKYASVKHEMTKSIRHVCIMIHTHCQNLQKQSGNTQTQKWPIHALFDSGQHIIYLPRVVCCVRCTWQQPETHTMHKEWGEMGQQELSFEPQGPDCGFIGSCCEDGLFSAETTIGSYRMTMSTNFPKSELYPITPAAYYYSLGVLFHSQLRKITFCFICNYPYLHDWDL